jgi:hypothetical protein
LMPGRTVVQWDKEDCADLGIIKVDLLGLGMMAVLKDCLELIPEHHGDRVDLAQLPEDSEVYRTLQRADTWECSKSRAAHRWLIKTNAGRAAIPGTTAPHGHDCREFHWCGGRGATSRCRNASLLGTHEEPRRKVASRYDGQRAGCRDPGKYYSEHQLVCALGLPGVARGQLRFDRVCLGLFQGEISGGFYLRHSQQSANGLLLPPLSWSRMPKGTAYS